MAIFKINNKIYNLPFNTKEEVVKFVNLSFKCCPVCGKVDIHLGHFNGNCRGRNKLEEEENLWK